jgi:hypothetical protein
MENFRGLRVSGTLVSGIAALCLALNVSTTAAEAGSSSAAEAPAAHHYHAAPVAPRHPRARHAGASVLDRRIAALSAALALDAAQQAGVRRVLEEQRLATERAWSDPAVPAALRVKATQNIAAHSVGEIRALLNDEQRKKYIQPRAAATQPEQRPNVETWMAGNRAN